MPERRAVKQRLYRPLLFLAGLVLIGLMGGAIYRALYQHPDYLPPLELQTDAGITSLSRFAGKPLLVYFWSTTCGVCQREIPDLIRLHDDLADSTGLVIVSIAMSYDPPNRVLEMSQHHQMPYVIGMDLNGRAADSLSVFATPTSFLVAPDGRIIDKTTGLSDFASLRQQVASLITSG